MMNKKDAEKIIKDLSEKPFVCSEHCIETESGYVITTKEKRKYARSKKQTNADRIRNMTDEELADMMFESCVEKMGLEECRYSDGGIYECKKCVLEWLQSEVKEGDSDAS